MCGKCSEPKFIVREIAFDGVAICDETLREVRAQDNEYPFWVALIHDLAARNMSEQWVAPNDARSVAKHQINAINTTMSLKSHREH